MHDDGEAGRKWWRQERSIVVAACRPSLLLLLLLLHQQAVLVHTTSSTVREIYNLPVNLFNFPVKQEKRCINPPLRAGDRVRVRVS